MKTDSLQSVDVWRAIANSVVDYAFLLLDRQGRIADCNLAAERMFGYSVQELIGQRGDLLLLPEDREAGVAQQEIGIALRDGRAEDERWYVRKNGTRLRASGTLTPVRTSESGVIGFAKILRDVTDREAERELLEQSLRERTLLLREVQHRVKNNLQMIVSLIALQADRVNDRKMLECLEETQNRVRAIAAIHERLYATEDFSTVYFGPYLQYLTRELKRTYNHNDRIEVHVEAADLALDVSHALPVALISNELVCNAFKHAFPNGRRGNIFARLKYISEPGANGSQARVELEIADDGAGLPEGIDARTADSMSFELVRILSLQIRAEVAVDTSSAGTAFRVSFSLPEEARTS